MNKPLVDVLSGRKPERRPIWFMRQAGRYLPEYREVRERAGSFLDLCYSPELACEVTLQPLRRFDIDAAILFADILIVPHALGQVVGFEENHGPVLEGIRDGEGVARLADELDRSRVERIYESVSRIAERLTDNVALIGFCGAPWTVATYMVEGGSSAEKKFARRAAMKREKWFDDLIERLVTASVEYLAGQVRAGADVVQIFDSWAGDLSPQERERYCFEPIRKIIQGLHERVGKVPVIGFARGIGPAQIEFARQSGASAIGIESNVSPAWVVDNLVEKVPVQGNLDPVGLVVGGRAMEAAVRDIVAHLAMERHVMNLGHGIRKETPVENVERVVRLVREHDRTDG